MAGTANRTNLLALGTAATWALFGMGLLAATASAAPPDKPAACEVVDRGDDEGEITFNFDLALRVWVWTPRPYGGREVGQTPSKEPLRLGADADRGVTPIGDTTLEAAVAEVRAKSVPGLCLPAVDDVELAQLKGLLNLRCLFVTSGGPFVALVEVTDAGLAHLKGLTELRWLFLCGTEVTDEGVEELQKAVPGLHVLVN